MAQAPSPVAVDMYGERVEEGESPEERFMYPLQGEVELVKDALLLSLDALAVHVHCHGRRGLRHRGTRFLCVAEAVHVPKRGRVVTARPRRELAEAHSRGAARDVRHAI